MSSSRDSEDLFTTQGNEPLAWIELARTLRLGSRPVYERLREIRDDSPNIDEVRLEKLGCVRAYMLLTAVAFENMLKAIAVKRGLLAADGGRLRRDVALSPRGGHGLSEIAKNLELELTSTDVDFLQRLEEYVVWAARYPVPELARHSSRAQERALLRMNFSDVELGEDLFDRLLKIALQAA